MRRRIDSGADAPDPPRRQCSIVEVDGQAFFGPFGAIVQAAPAGVRLLDPYDQLMGALYEARVADQDFDVPYFVESASRSAGRVLELGCGGGRLTLPLARAGACVHAVDRSKELLRTLHGRAARAGLSARIVTEQRDFFRGLSGGRYSCVVIGAGMFATFAAQGGERWLRGLGRLLLPGGELIFDLNAPLPGAQEPTFAWGTYELRGGRVWMLEGSCPLDDDLRVTNVYVESSPEGQRYLASERIFDPAPAQLARLLGHAGFRGAPVCELVDAAGTTLATGWSAVTATD